MTPPPAINPRGTTERGYGTPHQKTRAVVERDVKAGRALCVFCTLTIQPEEPWDLDHNEDRTGYRGAAHRRCNRSAGGRNGASVTNALRGMTVRDW